MQIYPFRNPQSVFANRAPLDGDVRSIVIGGYASTTVPWSFIKSVPDEELGTGPGFMQVVAGLWQCAKFVAAMLDMDRPFIRGLYAGLPPHEQTVFAANQLAPSNFNLQVAIKDQTATHFSRRGGQPLLTFGTWLMAGHWLRSWEYVTVAARLHQGRYDATMEQSWYRVVTHEYAHVLAPFYFKQYNYPCRFAHSEPFCLALIDIRRRFPFTMFPAIPVMPRVDYKPTSFRRLVIYRQGNVEPNEHEPAAWPSRVEVPSTAATSVTRPAGKPRYQTYMTPNGEKGRRLVGG